MIDLTVQRECLCPKPVESPNPRDLGCVKCGRVIAKEWTSNDTTMGRFFDRLASRWKIPPEDFDSFRRHCLQRERQGRDIFGHSFLSRNNPKEAREEAVDFANYCVFDVLQSIRNGEDPEEDLALTAAWHIFLAWRCAVQLERKHHAAP